MSMDPPDSSEPPKEERFDDVIREYIDFVNTQVGVYMDALAGFAGHNVRIERQIHRVSRPSGVRVNERKEPVVVWASYEDPKQPDIIHNRIVRAEDYVAINSRGGSNEQQHARAIIVFLYTAWESDLRPRLAKAKRVELNEIRADVMGDLKEVRHAIIHARGVLKADRHRKLKKLSGMFKADQPIAIQYEDMHSIFVHVKQSCAELMFEWHGVANSAELAAQMKDVAIQRPSSGQRTP